MINKPNLDFDFPQVDLPSNILAWHDIRENLLNLYKQACKLKACIFAICVKGKTSASINLIDYTINEGDLITLFPGSIIEFKGDNNPVQFCFVGFSSDVICQVNLMETCGTSYPKILDQPIINIHGPGQRYLQDYFTLFSNVTNDETVDLHPDIILYQLKSLLLGVSNVYEKQPYNPIACSRQEQIYRDLLQLITKHYLTERTAQFYAQQLGLTPQHLSTTVRLVTGGTVLDLIAHVVILDAKAKLKSTNLSVQEISYALNFPTPSFFGKYFKRYVGMSPLSYKQLK